ncbi:glutaminyl-tRNA synthetase [Scheffersomyces stipitis CBS 6054]|uniref:glutamine--tRNA ligase n=1 Tax=Scheffersomyces stipitis (strain ATCC 58785 / CBS 6054 / NBRC 10063 / NRRL Y-11545) TaxID=322104 RepID=A3LWA5_PICST|nr:glutaminyl-tRNA synthetase [Scheffersomyces stipitis CBS 6054]ABN66934.2 glutaminyl-tRNA synthetase [Scheffersomyces stipitis CBS 6054]
MSSDEELVALFERVGLSDKKSVEIIKNKKVSASLSAILDEAKIDSAVEEKKLSLLHQLAVETSKSTSTNNRVLVSAAILDGRIKTNLQISEAVKFISGKENGSVSVDELNDAAGVGQELSAEDVKAVIADWMNSNKQEIESKRYSVLPRVLGEVKKLPSLKWAAPNLFKPIIDDLFLQFCGPKDDRDVVKKEKKKKAPAASGDAKSKTVEPERSMFSEGFLGDLHKPGDQPQKYPELIKEHLAFSKGKVLTRFPPEPNGFLHIGHSKAIMVNFGYAKFHDGNCYLRFDDTNPEAEEEVYFNSIKDMVEWLGFEPWKITYSSDYFDQLYDLAEKLINSGYAYVCQCTPEEVKANRGMKPDGTLGGERSACSHRSKSVEQNLEEFRKMKNGGYAVGEATLRMKQDLESPSPQMWDLVAYRVLNTPHHRTGDKWKIYPTYDFTHCLVDSFENISHSLCTTEFRLSRESYEWLCDVLHVYRPAQREYGRLNITGTIMSKRKIAKLVNEGYVRGWDDPRLYTLEAIRRRGIPPGAILSFINTLGVTTSTTNIQAVRFESAVRGFLDQTTPRLMMVLNPIEVVVDNVDEDYEETIEIPYKPGKGGESFGSRTIKFGKRVYIDRADIREEEADKDYFRLAPGQPVGLMKVPFNISFKSVEKDADGNITKVHVNYDNDGAVKKPKTFIHWVPKKDAIPVKQVRIYNQLFHSENPSAHPDGYLADINPDSEEVIVGAVVEPSFRDVVKKSPLNAEVAGSQFNIKEKKGNNTVRFQALREGYFCEDKDSTADEVVLNRIVTLKEDSAKN